MKNSQTEKNIPEYFSVCSLGQTLGSGSGCGSGCGSECFIFSSLPMNIKNI